MKINYSVQDESGMTALMYAAKYPHLSFVVDHILRNDPHTVSITDKNGETVLFDSVHHIDLFKKILGSIDKTMIHRKNHHGDIILSAVLHQYREAYINLDREVIINCISVLHTLIEWGCDLNDPIDSDGDTPIMFFLMLEDYATTYYYLLKRHGRKIDLSIKNKNGINATYLSLFIKVNSVYSKLLKDELVCHQTYDFSYIDSYGNNMMMHMVIRDDSAAAINLLLKNKNSINHVNDRKENLLILSVKFGCHGMLSNYLFKEINIDQQDDVGNTALHYAIQLKDKFSINSLCFNKANLYIKNNKGITPYDLAVSLNDDSILSLLLKPVNPILMKKELNTTRFLLLKRMNVSMDTLFQEKLKSNIFYKDYEHLLQNKENKYSLDLPQEDHSKRQVFEEFLCDYYKTKIDH
ncbi:hypothetical protein PIROE2DRAFT_64735 [Piromyces sp. E2]|nr:hypothetical protein PIROE2DRAFT_64735 [Piromyces sp. E2]|eukprot:OUM57916.1 hypothetical protein PIROE2DRAFT_64735 [Piromyces sp. E2]